MGERRHVTVLLVLVLLGSALSVALAVTRPDAAGAGDVPTATEPYEPADLVGPSGDALDAAVAALPLSLTYDHRDLAASLKAATRRMTGAYAETFTRTFDRSVRPFARERKAVTKAEVRAAGVVRTRGDSSALCLLYVDQLLVSGTGLERGAKPKVLRSSRVLVDLVVRDGVWRIDGIEVV